MHDTALARAYRPSRLSLIGLILGLVGAAVAAASTASSAAPAGGGAPAASAGLAEGPGVPGDPPTRIPILMYHHIRDPQPEDSAVFRDLSCPPAEFVAHLEMLREEGYQPLTFLEILEYLARDLALPEKPIVLTFDDGARNGLHAARALYKFGWRGVFFVTTKVVGGPKHFKREHLRVLADHGFEIASHSETHPDLTQLSPRRLKQELEGSKAKLEAWIGRPVFTFSYPAGRQNDAVREAIERAGYMFARTTRVGVSDLADDPYALPMIRIHDTTKAASLRWALKKYLEKDPPPRLGLPGEARVADAGPAGPPDATAAVGSAAPAPLEPPPSPPAGRRSAVVLPPAISVPGRDSLQL